MKSRLLFANLFTVMLALAACTLPAHAADTPPANAPTSEKPELVDDIVAIVNNDVITRNELDERYQRAVQQLNNRKIALPPKNILEKQLLDRMILDRIQLQYAAQTGIKVDEAALDEAILRIAEQNHLTLDQFKEALAKDHVPFNRFRDDIRHEIILNRLRQRDVDNKVNVSEAEVDAYLTAQAKSGADEEFHLARISIDIPNDATSDQIAAAQAKAEDVLKKLHEGASFAEMSTEYSNAPNALEGGDLGWRPAAQLPPQFVDIIRALKPGETTNVLRTSEGFHIIELIEERSTDKPAIISQTHARHILIKTNEIVTPDDAIKRLTDIRNKIISGKATFGAMAKQYSDDSSAAKGGDLGWLSPGETVPEFEQAMDALKPGEISQPIKSPFGYHLIQVLERRQKDVTLNHRHQVAMQAIRARKIEEAQTDWLREMRDEAYVKIFPLDQ